jgi:hypothetical protein
MDRLKTFQKPVTERAVGLLATVIATVLTQFCRVFVGTPAR